MNNRRKRGHHKPAEKQVVTAQTKSVAAEPKKDVGYESALEDIAEVLAPHKQLRLKPTVFALILIVTGLVGLFASFVLTVDKIHILKDPAYQPSCNINPVISCGSVMQSKQAEVAGIPNTLFGLIGFPMVITVAAVILAGGRMHRRFWRLWMLGMLGGFGGFLYLYFQSVFRLKTLCIYCMSTWIALLPLVWYSFLWCLQHEYIPTPQRLRGVVRFIRRDHLSILLSVYLVAIVIIVWRFWYFFKTL